MDWDYDEVTQTLTLVLTINDLWRMRKGAKVWGPTAAMLAEELGVCFEFGNRPMLTGPDAVSIADWAHVRSNIPYDIPPEPEEHDTSNAAFRARFESGQTTVTMQVSWPINRSNQS